MLSSRDGFDTKIEDLGAEFRGADRHRRGKRQPFEAAGSAEFKISFRCPAARCRGAAGNCGCARPCWLRSIRVIYVSTTRERGVRSGASISLAQEEAILKDDASLAAHYNVEVTTTIRAGISPEKAILREIETTDVAPGRSRRCRSHPG